MSKAGRQERGILVNKMLLVSFDVRCISQFQTERNVFARFTVATSPMLFSPIPPALSLSTASKTNPGSVKKHSRQAGWNCWPASVDLWSLT